jgi:GNAT superfamily N-acetyltransferase
MRAYASRICVGERAFSSKFTISPHRRSYVRSQLTCLSVILYLANWLNATVRNSKLTTTPTLLRPPVHDDFAAWKVLWDGYNAFYGREGATALADTTTRATWRRLLEPTLPICCLVAERNGRIVGIAHYIFHLSTTHIESVCYLSDLFTSVDVRGEGIGRALIEAVYEKAKQENCGRVYWQTHEANSTARRLYDQVAEHAGFLIYRHIL